MLAWSSSELRLLILKNLERVLVRLFSFRANPFEYEEASNLIKQMELEALNQMDRDDIRKKVAKYKKEFDSVRKEMR